MDSLRLSSITRGDYRIRLGLWVDKWGLYQLDDALCGKVRKSRYPWPAIWDLSISNSHCVSLPTIIVIIQALLRLTWNRALTGLPIQGAILNQQNGSYLGLQLFSAVVMVAGGITIGVARMFIASSSNSAKV